jgi:hypothetical protein
MFYSIISVRRAMPSPLVQASGIFVAIRAGAFLLGASNAVANAPNEKAELKMDS